MPRDFPRSRRIEDQIQRILSDVIRSDLRDPRFAGVFITAVRVSRDLSVAWIYYSVLNADGEAEDLTGVFRSALGFLRSRLAKELTLRRVPELRFEFDKTLSDAAAMDELIDTAVNHDKKAGPAGDLDDDGSDEN
jgi:ribosome-binding factor A